MTATTGDRVTRIVLQLEDAFGEPRWRGRGNVMDSLIQTVLSQSTNDRNRDTAYRKLKQRYPCWSEMHDAPAEQIADAIRSAGLANQKSVRIREILRWARRTYGSFDLDFICDLGPEKVREILIPLKGVGIKTISVILMFTCGKDIFPVDTHVHRICRRLGLVPDSASAVKTHELMQPQIPPAKSFSLHMNFLKLGRTICRARNPDCPRCPLRQLCPFPATS